MIYLESNILRIPTGNFPYLIFMTDPAQQMSNIHSDISFDCELNGNLDIAVYDKETLQVPDGFSLLVLTLDISDREN